MQTYGPARGEIVQRIVHHLVTLAKDCEAEMASLGNARPDLVAKLELATRMVTYREIAGKVEGGDWF